MALQPVCFWPGLPAAWLLGLSRGLLMALFFAWSLCLLTLATFVWPEWTGAGWLRLGWTAAGLTWLVSTIGNCLTLPRLLQIHDQQGNEGFQNAQVEYLRGNWFEAEALLLEVLHRSPRDAEAALLLVGVLRRTQRWRPALRRLDQLELLDTGGAWRFEIAREKELIERAMVDETTAEVAAGQNDTDVAIADAVE